MYDYHLKHVYFKPTRNNFNKYPKHNQSSKTSYKSIKTGVSDDDNNPNVKAIVFIVIIIVTIFSFVVYNNPGLLFLLLLPLILALFLLGGIAIAEVLNSDHLIGGEGSPWTNLTSPVALKKMIEEDRKIRLINNRVCGICGHRLAATQTTCQCGHIVNCIICYLPIYEHIIVFDCCFTNIHERHLTNLNGTCPYCKSSPSRFIVPDHIRSR